MSPPNGCANGLSRSVKPRVWFTCTSVRPNVSGSPSVKADDPQSEGFRLRFQFLRRLTHVVSGFSLSRERGQRLLRIRWVPPDSFAEIGRNDARSVVAAQPGDIASGMR